MSKGRLMQVLRSIQNVFLNFIGLLWYFRREHNENVIQAEKATNGTNTVERNSFEFETSIRDKQRDFDSTKFEISAEKWQKNIFLLLRTKNYEVSIQSINFVVKDHDNLSKFSRIQCFSTQFPVSILKRF